MRRLVVACLSVLPLAAQGSAPTRPAPHQSWMPLEVGAFWELEDDAKERVTLECTARFEGKNGAGWYYVRRDGNERLPRAPAVWEAWAVHAGGIHRCRAVGGKGDAFRCWETPVCVLALPVGIEAAWDERRAIGPPTLPEPDERQPPPADYRAELLHVRERIEVPAGAFAAACVRTVGRDDGRTSTLWFAAGVGLVRLEETDRQGRRRTFVLVRHGGPDIPVDADLAAAVRRALAADARLAALGPPLRLEQVRDREVRRLFKSSRFCSVHWETGSVLLRERSGVVGPLDALGREGWDRLLADEGVKLRDDVRDTIKKARDVAMYDSRVAAAVLQATACLLLRTGGGVLDEGSLPELADLVRNGTRRPTIRVAASGGKTLELEIVLGVEDARVGQLGLK